MAMKTLDHRRIDIAAMCVGQARRPLPETTRHAVERRQFGRPIGEFRLTRAAA